MPRVGTSNDRLEKLVAEYVMAKAAVEKAKKDLDVYRATLSTKTDTVEEIRAAIYNRATRMGLGIGKSLHTTKAMLSMAEGPKSVVILDADKVPDAYMRFPDPEVDKAKVMSEWRENNRRVPGTRIDTGDPVLTIRI